MSVIIPVGVGYNEDLEKVEKVTIEVAKQVIKKVDGAIKEFEPIIRFKKFGDYITNFINIILLSIVYFIGIGLTSIIGKSFKTKFLPTKHNSWFNIKKRQKEEFLRQF